jgi:predicted RND superfamily exporter protein
MASVQAQNFMKKIFVHKKYIVLLFIVFAVISSLLLHNLRFSFDISQFFPEGDEDLEFYQEFSKDFGSDDNFLLVAVENKADVFEKDFLNRFHRFSLASRKLPHVEKAESLTTLSYPLKTSFGIQNCPLFI